MIIYPAMDLIDGKVVRLEQGRFDKVTPYSTEPNEALREFASAGAGWAHVVDLDGARLGEPRQHELIGGLATSTPLRLQVAGGFRTRDQVARMLDRGVERVVIGSLAVRNPELVATFLDEFGAERIGLALDVRLVRETPFVAVAGWLENSGKSLWDLWAVHPDVRHVIVTDISRDGMLDGPNFALYDEIARRLPRVQVQASGGISSAADLEGLSTAGAIIGKALWDGRLRLGEALSLARA